MRNKYKKYMVIIMVFAVGISSSVHACMTTFINDSGSKVAIFNESDKTFMCISKDSKRRFGSHDKHAHFVVYMQQPQRKTEVWAPVYTCKQNTCGTNGNIMLKFTNLHNNNGHVELFTVIKHKPHSPMVDKLPMIQKNDCQVCNEE